MKPKIIHYPVYIWRDTVYYFTVGSLQPLETRLNPSGQHNLIHCPSSFKASRYQASPFTLRANASFPACHL